jgi:hypothetical protein
MGLAATEHLILLADKWGKGNKHLILKSLSYFLLELFQLFM